jgi:hypothetical protein
VQFSPPSHHFIPLRSKYSPERPVFEHPQSTNSKGFWRMVSSVLLRRVALVRTDVSEEPDVSFIRVTKIGELGTTQAATSNRRTLRRNTKYW